MSRDRICKLCGEETGQLRDHLSKVHGINVGSEELDSYNARVLKFPGVQAVLSKGLSSPKGNLILLNDNTIWYHIIRGSPTRKFRPFNLSRLYEKWSTFILSNKEKGVNTIIGPEELDDKSYTMSRLRLDYLEKVFSDSTKKVLTFKDIFVRSTPSLLK